MHISNNTVNELTSLTVINIFASISLKLVQLRASLKTLRSRMPLNAENAPPVEKFSPPVDSIIISTRDSKTMAASKRLKESFVQSLKPSPINLIIISAIKHQVKMLFQNSAYSCISQLMGYESVASTDTFSMINTVIAIVNKK